MTCLQCGETSPIITRAGLCPTCDRAIDRKVEAMEQRLEKNRAVRHYADLAAEAAAGTPARLGRIDESGQRVQEAAPAFVNAGGTEP